MPFSSISFLKELFDALDEAKLKLLHLAVVQDLLVTAIILLQIK
jgi:hypothetical protein